MGDKIKNFIKALYFFPGKCYNGIRLRLHRFSVGKKFKSTGRIAIINHGNKSKIGEDVTIHSSWRANPIGCGSRTILRLLRGGSIEIGNHVGMSNVAITCRESVVIDDYALIGSGVKIYDTDFHSLNPAVRMRLAPKEPAKTKPVRIGAFSFIGAGAFILKGAQIGVGSIVGAGSVVTGKIPDWQIWAGNPARFIREIPEDERGEVETLLKELNKQEGVSV